MENNNTNPNKGLNGYKAFYNNKEYEVYAATSYEAQQKAIEHFKPKKSQKHMVHVHLCERSDGSEVVHKPDF